MIQSVSHSYFFHNHSSLGLRRRSRAEGLPDGPRGPGGVQRSRCGGCGDPLVGLASLGADRGRSVDSGHRGALYAWSDHCHTGGFSGFSHKFNRRPVEVSGLRWVGPRACRVEVVSQLLIMVEAGSRLSSVGVME